ncbi:MAG: hypothetical protein AAGF12_18390 [Myxococcota bacterium]
MTAENPWLEVRVDFRMQRRLLVAGMLGSLTVVICNTTLYGHGELEHWPQWGLNLAYWAGSAGLAFAGLGFLPTYVALRPAGRSWAAPPAVLLGYFLALGSAGHGSYFALYSVHQSLLSSSGSAPSADLEALRTTLETYTLVMTLIPVTALLVGSVWYSLAVLLRPTLLPRWMAAWNLFAISAVGFVLVELEVLPSVLHGTLKGFGFHLGVLPYFVLTYVFLARYARSTGDGKHTYHEMPAVSPEDREAKK